MIAEKLSLSLVNVFCPPLAVYLIAGAGPEVVLNCCLFLLGVLPGHCHSFYVTSVYFNRKRKVRKGRPLGGKRPLIWSQNVLRGGASAGQVEMLRREAEMREMEKQRVKGMRRTRRKESMRRVLSGGGRSGQEQWKEEGLGVEEWDEQSGIYVNGVGYEYGNMEAHNPRTTSQRMSATSALSSISPVSTRTNPSPRITRAQSNQYPPNLLSQHSSYPETYDRIPPLPHRRLTGQQRQAHWPDEGQPPPLPQRSQSARVNRQQTPTETWPRSPVLTATPQHQDTGQRDFLGYYTPAEYRQ